MGGLLDRFQLRGLLLQLTGKGFHVVGGLAQLGTELEALINRGAVGRSCLIDLGDSSL